MEFTIQKKEQPNVCDDKNRHICKTDPTEKLRPVTLSLLRYNHVGIGPHATNTSNGAPKQLGQINSPHHHSSLLHE